MRTVLIYHEDDIIDREVTARWLGSFSELSGLVVLREKKGRTIDRLRRERRRVGFLRLLDVLAFRVYYRLFHASRDAAWKRRAAAEISKAMPAIVAVPTITSESPNSAEVQRFIADAEPDLMIARCKVILKEEIFSIPRIGTFVLHPGICPEYRNAHGCFWALAEGDRERVGLTLLKIDKGIDTGPVYGYFSCDLDRTKESHIVIQNRVFTENLDAISQRLEAVFAGTAELISTAGRESRTWGQPWLTKYLRIRSQSAATPTTSRPETGGLELH